MGQTYQAAVIAAPISDVWAAIADFHNMKWSANVIEKLEVVGDVSGDQAGAKRLLNGVFAETLIEVSAADRLIRYSIDNGPPPISSDDVSDYKGHLQLHEITEGAGGTLAIWKSAWTGNDEAAGEFCHGVYVALLGDLVGHFA